MSGPPLAQARVVAVRRASARLSVLVALVPLAFVLFFVVSQGIQALNLDFFTQHAEAGRRSRAAAWRTPSSAR